MTLPKLPCTVTPLVYAIPEQSSALPQCPSWERISISREPRGPAVGEVSLETPPNLRRWRRPVVGPGKAAMEHSGLLHRGDMFEKRRRLMAARAAHCSSSSTSQANVVPLSPAKAAAQ
jgi:hypothetical protein